MRCVLQVTAVGAEAEVAEALEGMYHFLTVSPTGYCSSAISSSGEQR